MPREFASLIDLATTIPDEQAAIDHFTAIRWKNGAFCPYCGSVEVYHFTDKKTHKCKSCRQRFSIKVGTIFEDSKIQLRKWLMAIWLITSHKKGIASTQLAKDIRVTQKTAWFMLHRLRHASQTKSFSQPLKNFVEADETFIGGKNKNKHAGKRDTKSRGIGGKEMVVGLLERGGEFRAFHVKKGSKGLSNILATHVQRGSNLLTDEYPAYALMASGYHHYSVNHGAGEYVRDGFIHCNGVEGAWSLLKRQLYGIHHWVSPRHLHYYVSEMGWRYNRRAMREGERLNSLIANSTGRLRYAELIAR